MKSLARIVLVVLAALVVLGLLMILASSSVFADPDSGRGEGRFPGRTTTGSTP